MRRQSQAWRQVNRRKWETVRRIALDRDGWKCKRCGRRGRLDVHHIEGIAEGGDVYDLDNLETLCRPCHFSHNRAEGLKRQATLTPMQAKWRRMVDEMME